ncbi:MAG: citrate lyase acyl carrier protein [Deltaproteobacteria bacterium]|nr:citrate lyase acyl carrier protein [Deltaproteobacteria bacterium]
MPKLLKAAQAGTLESSDMLVAIAPAPEGAGVTVQLASPTLQQYGGHMKEVILAVLKECGVSDATVDANDKGAVDFVIEARVKTAVLRAAEAS